MHTGTPSANGLYGVTFQSYIILKIKSTIDYAFFTSVNDKLDYLISSMQACLNLHAPLKVKRVKRHSQLMWLTHDIRADMNQRDKLSQKCGNKKNQTG